MSGYIGNIPVPQATQTRDVFTATSGQTSFATSGYTPGFLDVWLNGVKLVNGTDFTATNGSDVVLASGAATSDIVEVLSYSTYEVNNQAFTGDFSVDGTTFKVDSTNNRVGIGTATPDVPFVLSGTNVRQKIVDGSNTLTLGQWDGLTNRIESSGRDMYLIQYGASNAIKFATNATERMVLDAAGRLTVPNQPAFLCRPEAGYAITAGEFTVDGTWTTDYNVGNHFNTSGGTFTAPVDGVYAFSWAIFASGSLGTRSDAWISANGVVRLRTEINSYNAGSVNRSQHVHGQLKLSANDVVRFGTYQVNNCTIYTTTSPWSYAAGILIG